MCLLIFTSCALGGTNSWQPLASPRHDTGVVNSSAVGKHNRGKSITCGGFAAFLPPLQQNQVL